MIEQDVYVYLKNDATLNALLGATGNVFIMEAPTIGDILMPWVIVEVTSGSRTKISQNKMEEIAYVRVSVDAGPAQAFVGRNAVERCKVLLENYRGCLSTAMDTSVSIGAIRGWAGFGGAYRYQFDAIVRFTEAYSQPIEVGN
jgi:hypothetical protein